MTRLEYAFLTNYFVIPRKPGYEETNAPCPFEEAFWTLKLSELVSQ